MDRRRFKEKTYYSRLPDDYQEVEYLEATSINQYIKTDILYSQMFDYYLGLESFTFTSNYRILYSESGISGWLAINMNQGIWRGYDFKSYTSIPSMTKGNYAFLASSSQVLKDGQPYGNTSADGGNTFGGNICLLKGIMQISYLRVVDGGNIIMHLIPCYRKTDNKSGMYDTVNNKFYTNAGTGEFIVGPNIEPDCDLPGELGPDNPMKAKFIGYKKVGELPNEYQQVEYLEGGLDYNAFIDTEYYPNGHTTIFLDASMAYNITRWVYGVRPESSARIFALATNNSIKQWIFGYGNNIGNYKEPTQPAPDGERHTFWQNKGGKNIIDDTYIGEIQYQDFQSEYPLQIFQSIGGGTHIGVSWAKIYQMRIYDNNVLVRDFIPCYRKSDNVKGFYDAVNAKFYTNTGTGDFLVGQDVPNQIIVYRLWDYKRGTYNPETGEFTKY